ncbi:uncharacterized protein ALTATR162_LOCUS2839 [Alternaria atra]|uniref:Uncharacterized protein n=1 Tax=Alternaria atra TaxID=119953 RepID=A0A8J2HZ04_9PLEO|nr:uncharacterized protein ALTATR162_LOCUS2839 [Alternaria atra]CAG5152603.1 unnamed protein product [Alternaria atra]
MHLLSILTLFASLATAIPLSASPYKNPDTCPAPPANPGVFFCLGHNFKGNCFHQPYTNNGWCGNFPDFESRPRSVGPDLGGYCIFFNKTGCGTWDEAVDVWKGSNENRSLECPGMSDTGKPDWFMSVQCFGEQKPPAEEEGNPSGGEWKGNEGLRAPGER